MNVGMTHLWEIPDTAPEACTEVVVECENRESELFKMMHAMVFTDTNSKNYD